MQNRKSRIPRLCGGGSSHSPTQSADYSVSIVSEKTTGTESQSFGCKDQEICRLPAKHSLKDMVGSEVDKTMSTPVSRAAAEDADSKAVSSVDEVF